jgi:hypothetical protein
MWSFENRWNIQALELMGCRRQQSAATSRKVCGNWNRIALSDWVGPTEAC